MYSNLIYEHPTTYIDKIVQLTVALCILIYVENTHFFKIIYIAFSLE